MFKYKIVYFMTYKELEFSLFWVTRYFLVTFAIFSNALLFRYFFSKKPFITFSLLFGNFDIILYFTSLKETTKFYWGKELR